MEILRLLHRGASSPLLLRALRPCVSSDRFISERLRKRQLLEQKKFDDEFIVAPSSPRFFYHHKRFRFFDTGARWRRLDKMAADYRLVYIASSKTAAQYSVLLLQGSPVFLTGFFAYDFLFDNSHMSSFTPELMVMAPIGCAISFALYKVWNMYPIRIYYSEDADKFAVIYIGKHVFDSDVQYVAPGELKRDEAKDGLMGRRFAHFIQGIYKLPNGRKMFIGAEDFISARYFNNLVGFDRDVSGQ